MSNRTRIFMLESPIHAPSLSSPQRRVFLTRLASVAALGSSLPLVACGGGSEDQAAIRFVNATVDYATADFWVGDETAIAGLANGGASSGYGSEDSGTLQVSLHAAGSSSAVYSASRDFATDSSTSVIAYGSLATSLTFRFLDESNAAAASGTFNVRALHVAPSLGGLDIYITNTSSLSGLSPTLSVSAYGELSSFVNLGSGTYRVRITKTGDQSSVLFDYTAGLTIGGATVLTLAIAPRSSGSLPNIAALPEKSSPLVLVNELA